MSMELSKKAESLLLLIWTQALIATLGSLYFSEFVGYVPCDLCWIQRIFMYPLIIIYGSAIIKKDSKIALPGLILSGIGMLIAIYHYGIQKLPALNDVGGFCGDVPCNLQYINYFGFITIPFLSAVAFIVIFISHLILLREKNEYVK